MNKQLKVWILAGLAVVTTVAVFCLKPIPQDPAYHRFADTREGLGIPNFWNVVGNLFFLLVGVWGWIELTRRRVWTGGYIIYGVLFGGIFLTGLGSAYYHWSPDNDRLIWDRVPMAVVFMSLLAAVVGEWVDRKAALWLLGPLVALGVFSVLWWHHTEVLGRGDLRLYGWVQFFPALVIVLILVMFGEKGKRIGVRSLVWAVVWYAAAKVLEYFDNGILSLTGIVSGHALKHVAAALSTAYLVKMFRDRYPEGGHQGETAESAGEPNANDTRARRGRNRLHGSMNIKISSMGQAPELSKEFFCVANRDEVALAAVVLSYIAKPGVYVPFFEFPVATVEKVEGDDTVQDRHSMSRRRSYTFGVYVGNCFAKLNGSANLILIGLSPEQKSYLKFWHDDDNVIDIPNIEIAEMALMGFAAEKGVLSCRNEDIFYGLYRAMAENARLSISATAEEIERPNQEAEGLVVIEAIEAVAAVIATSYAWSVGANILAVPPLAPGEDDDIRYFIERWQGGSQVDYDRLAEMVNCRVGLVDFRTYRYCTFFTLGIPYSLVLDDVIPFSYVHLFWRMDWFLFNGILAEHDDAVCSAVVFSPEFFAGEEETAFVAATLESRGYFVKQLLAAEATAYNFDMHAKEYPYDLLHICSHGGNVTGQYCIQRLVDDEGVEHALELDMVRTFHPGGHGTVIPVHTKFYFRKYDGRDWDSPGYRQGGQIPHELFDRFLETLHTNASNGSLSGQWHTVPNSPSIRCHDFAYLGMFDACAGGRISPFMFNNSCWSWSTVAEPFIYGGARGYIGTLWNVRNDVAVETARAFYDKAFGETISKALQDARRVGRGTSSEGIYVFWGLHFSTLKAGRSVEASKENVVGRMIDTSHSWIDKATTHVNGEVRTNSQALADWNERYLYENFRLETIRLLGRRRR